MAVVATILVALATFGVVRLLSRYAIIYGRRRIVMMVLIGFLFGSLLRTVPLLAGMSDPSGSTTMDCFCVIGYIVPGLIALWMDRQGWVETLAPLATSSIVVRLVLVMIGMEILS
jgi:poly-gamma-glutamate biosynthesis protein PgsC/CapC